MVETQGIEQVLSKLVELLTAKKDDASSTGKQIMAHIDTTQKLELMPIDIKLEGIKNYLAWSRRAILQLKSKKLEDFVTGEVDEPRDKGNDEWKAWDATNSLVAAWLLNSMSPSIAGSVDAIATASGIWEVVSKMFSGIGNVMLLAETDDKIHHLKQGELSLMDYVAELKRLWADLDHYDPIELPHPECVAWVRKWMEKRRVLQFLRALNPEFEERRAAIFYQSSLPSLEEAIAAMAQEESRLKITKGNDSSPSHPAFVVTKIGETRTCYNCGEKGHISHECRQPFKPNRGRGRENFRGTTMGRGSRGRGRGYKANFAMSEEGVSDMVTVPAAELEELRRLIKYEKCSKLNDQPTTTTSSDNTANLVHSDLGEEDWKKTWDWSAA